MEELICDSCGKFLECYTTSSHPRGWISCKECYEESKLREDNDNE